MMTYLLWLFPIIGLLLFIYLKKTPHGWVQWRTGVALKLLPNSDHLTPVEQRIQLNKLSARGLPRIQKKLPVASIHDIEIPTRYQPIKARIYNDHADSKLSPILYIHGGGFCFGDLDMFEEVCRRLARVCKRQVISIEYSLAPEHKFPRMHHECEDAAMWIAEHHQTLGISSSQIIPMGDSAGGNLAISIVFALRQRGIGDIIAALIPVYPSMEGYPNTTSSLALYGEHYILTHKKIASFSQALVSNSEDLSDPRLLLAVQKDLGGFPPTFIINAEFDPLNDDGKNFAERLLTAGNSHVERKVYKGTIHAFFGVAILGDQGVNAVNDVAAFLKNVS